MIVGAILKHGMRASRKNLNFNVIRYTVVLWNLIYKLFSHILTRICTYFYKELIEGTRCNCL